MAQSPQFKLDAFEQDIHNLRAFLDRFELMYQLVPRDVQVNEEGEPFRKPKKVEIPKFVLEQFLGRLCLVIDEMQQVNLTPENDGLVARCPVHGTEAEGTKFMYFDNKAFCLNCMVVETGCEAGWASPEEGEFKCED